MSENAESLANYAALVAIAAGLVWYDLQVFALYAFMVIVGLIIHFTNRLWKLASASHASNAMKLLVIARKLGVADEEYDRMAAEIRARDPRASASVEHSFRDL